MCSSKQICKPIMSFRQQPQGLTDVVQLLVQYPLFTAAQVPICTLGWSPLNSTRSWTVPDCSCEPGAQHTRSSYFQCEILWRQRLEKAEEQIPAALPSKRLHCPRHRCSSAQCAGKGGGRGETQGLLPRSPHAASKGASVITEGSTWQAPLCADRTPRGTNFIPISHRHTTLVLLNQPGHTSQHLCFQVWHLM